MAGAEQRRGLGGWATGRLEGWEEDFPVFLLPSTTEPTNCLAGTRQPPRLRQIQFPSHLAISADLLGVVCSLYWAGGGVEEYLFPKH